MVIRPIRFVGVMGGLFLLLAAIIAAIIASRGAVHSAGDAILAVLEDTSVADLVADAKQGVDYTNCLEHLLRPMPFGVARVKRLKLAAIETLKS